MENELAVIEERKQEAVGLEQKAQAVIVSNDEQAVMASDLAGAIKGSLKTAQEFFAPIVEAAHKAHKIACERRNMVCDPLDRALKIVNDRVAGYTYEQQQKAQEAERKARLEAEEKERKEREKLEEQARAAKKAGKVEEAAHLREQATTVYVAPKPVAAPVRTGTSVRFVYDVEVLDKARVPERYKIVDESMLKRLVTADPSLVVPGVKFTKRPTGSTRAA